MAKNSIDAYGAAGKTNLLVFDPQALALVTDEKSPLYDPRVHLPIDEALVLNIMHQGVLEPVLICKNTESGAVEVVAGRQRVKAAREANVRLLAKGCAPVQVPAIVKRAEGADLAGVMVSENEIRQADTPIGRAEKMRRLMDYGKTEADLAVLFGCGGQTIKSTLALLDCCAAVRSAVEAGKIGVTHARALSKMEPAEQRAKVSDLIAAGESEKGHAKARKQRSIVEPSTPKTKTRREIIVERDSSNGERRAALDWVLGATPAALALVA